MNTPTDHTTTSPEVTRALDAARAELRRAEADVRTHRNAIRRWARQNGCTLLIARVAQQNSNRPAWDARVRAESAYRLALREFRRVALIAALMRVVDADRRLRAA